MKRVLCLSIALALFLSLPSCRSERDTEIESEILAVRAENEAKAESLEALPEPAPTNADSMTSPTDADSGTETQEEPSPGTDAETAGDPPRIAEEKPPVKTEPRTDWDGILSSEYQVVGQKYYFNTMAKKDVPDRGKKSVNITSFVDLGTLEHDVICPDPLCGHDDPALCKYIDVGGFTDFMLLDENTYIRGYKTNPNAKTKLYRFDLTNNGIALLFTPKETSPTLLGMDKGYLWLFDVYSKIKKHETVTTASLYAVHPDTGEIAYQKEMPDNYNPFLIYNGAVYCETPLSILLFDVETGEEHVICRFENGDQIGAWYLDTFDGSFWFSILNKTKQTGKVFRWDGDACEQIRLPAEEIYHFQLTHTKLIYSPYDPVYLGENPSVERGTYDYVNGKVYAVDRAEPQTSPTLIYDTNGTHFLCSNFSQYCVFGNQLFFYKINLWHSDEDGKVVVAFDLAKERTMIRVDLTTGEEEYIGFD